MMDEDDLAPRAKKPGPKKLGMMSIEALHEYIVELEAEIARAGETIAEKEAARASAEAVFRT